jgi:acyl-CoA hydrolase
MLAGAAMFTALPNRPHWLDLLKSGNRIYIGSNAAVPNGLIDDLITNGKGLHDIELVHINTLSESRWVEPAFNDLFKVNTFFIGSDKIRQAVAEGRVDYTPCFLSEVPSLFEQDILPLDAALVMVSPPDKYGYCSLGVAVDVNLAANKYDTHS